jgi:hypothetical protein
MPGPVSKPTTPGYSGRPLAAKLGIKANAAVCLYGAPEDYAGLLDPLPDGVKFSSELTADTDVVHLFATVRADLAEALAKCRREMRPDAMVWASWPKKSAKVPTDITEDTIREVALPLGLVDVKVCAVNEVWSGLKLVIRKELR